MTERRERDADAELFEEAMAHVRRMPHDRHLPEPVFRRPAPLSQREREALLELDRLVAGEGALELSDGDAPIQGAVRGLDPRVLKRLRRGDFAVQADLDLHGVDAETARGLVERFIAEGHARSLRCLRIVHGRGRNSPDGIPVLKSNLPRWLARGPARRLVLAYATAAARDGGAGATYVLLRRR